MRSISMGVHRHGQWEEGHLPLPGNVVKCFCALVTNKMLSDVSVDVSVVSFSRLCSQTRTESLPLDPAGGLLSPDLLICPPLEKILLAPMNISFVD